MNPNPYSPTQLGQLLGVRKTYRRRGKKAHRGGKSRRATQRGGRQILPVALPAQKMALGGKSRRVAHRSRRGGG